MASQWYRSCLVMYDHSWSLMVLRGHSILMQILEIGANQDETSVAGLE